MSCNCGCDDSITALQGVAGDDGTSTGVATSSFSTAASSLEYVYTANRANTASNALDYDWSVITIPAVSTANVAIFSAMFQVNATTTHDVTITVLNTLSGAPVSGINFIQNAGTRELINVRFEIANVAQNDVFALHIVSSDPAVTPLLKGGNCEIKIYC